MASPSTVVAPGISRVVAHPVQRPGAEHVSILPPAPLRNPLVIIDQPLVLKHATDPALQAAVAAADGPPVTVNLNMATGPPPPHVESAVGSGPDDSDVSSLSDGGSVGYDNTLEKIMNPRKLKPKESLAVAGDTVFDVAPLRPKAAPRQRAPRKPRKQRKRAPSIPSSSSSSESSAIGNLPFLRTGRAQSSRSRTRHAPSMLSSGDDSDAPSSAGGGGLSVLEHARLWARYTQLENDGYTPPQLVTDRTPTPTLQRIVYAMEVQKRRGEHIDMNRTFLMLLSNGIESGAKRAKQRWPTSPFVPNLENWSESIFADRKKFDDCIERLRERYLGDDDQAMHPLLEFAGLLATSAFMFNLSKGVSENPANLAAAFKNNPELINMLSAQVAEQQRLAAGGNAGMPPRPEQRQTSAFVSQVPQMQPPGQMPQMQMPQMQPPLSGLQMPAMVPPTVRAPSEPTYQTSVHPGSDILPSGTVVGAQPSILGPPTAAAAAISHNREQRDDLPVDLGAIRSIRVSPPQRGRGGRGRGRNGRGRGRGGGQNGDGPVVVHI